MWVGAEPARHVAPAALAAVLFGVGLLLAGPVVRLRLRAVEWLPERMLRFVACLMGPRPGIVRTAVVIWLFNAAVMFLCMASGFHPAVPLFLCIWTGLNVGTVTLRAAAQDAPALEALARPAPGAWRPPGWLAVASGVLVLLLELPCFAKPV